MCAPIPLCSVLFHRFQIFDITFWKINWWHALGKDRGAIAFQRNATMMEKVFVHPSPFRWFQIFDITFWKINWCHALGKDWGAIEFQRNVYTSELILGMPFQMKPTWTYLINIFFLELGQLSFYWNKSGLIANEIITECYI